MDTAQRVARQRNALVPHPHLCLHEGGVTAAFVFSSGAEIISPSKRDKREVLAAQRRALASIKNCGTMKSMMPKAASSQAFHERSMMQVLLIYFAAFLVVCLIIVIFDMVLRRR